MIRKLAMAALPLFALSACDLLGGGGGGSGYADGALEAIHAVEGAQFEAVEADDLAGAIAPYAPDAIFVAPGAGPVSGPAISQIYEALLADEAFALEMVEGSQSATVAAGGDLAVTGFAAMMTHTDEKSGTVTEQMVNQTVWQLNEAGSWQIVSDVNYFVPDAEEPAAAAAPEVAATAAASAAPAAPARTATGKPTDK